MRWLRLLCVTLLLALVYTTIEFPLACIPALEHARPAFHNRLIALNSMRPLTFNLVSTIGAKQFLFHLPTIALGWNTLFACATEAFMTWSWASMLTTWHDLVADFATAPT
jgi:hypothetical protein